jgi:UDP-2,3-diacylglucosamine hydrolase
VGQTQAPTAFPVLEAGAQWRCVDLLSDLHLHPHDPDTFAVWRRHLQSTAADAVFLLGDVFEAWVGDDAIDTPGFAADCALVLREASAQRPLFFLHGNRDFLVGDALARTCGFALMADPTVLTLGTQRWLLTHGDALCLSDTDYLAFRAQVRTPEWQSAFLRRPLAEREALARQMREASEVHHRTAGYVSDVDPEMACEWLDSAGAPVMIHGHTHRPGQHDLGQGRLRIVLSDWDARATPPRLQVLRLTASGEVQRLDLAA